MPLVGRKGQKARQKARQIASINISSFERGDKKPQHVDADNLGAGNALTAHFLQNVSIGESVLS